MTKLKRLAIVGIIPIRLATLALTIGGHDSPAIWVTPTFQRDLRDDLALGGAVCVTFGFDDSIVDASPSSRYGTVDYCPDSAFRFAGGGHGYFPR